MPSTFKKRTHSQRNSDRLIISRYLMAGLAEGLICVEINRNRPPENALTPKQVKLDIEAINLEWERKRHFNLNAAMNKQLDLLAFIQNEASTAWEKSKLPKQVRIQTGRSRGTPILVSGQPAFDKAGMVLRDKDEQSYQMNETGQVGEPRFLEVMLKCFNARNELFGFAAKQGQADLEEKIQAEWERVCQLRQQLQLLKSAPAEPSSELDLDEQAAIDLQGDGSGGYE